MPIDMNVLRKQERIVGATFKNGNKPLVNLYDVKNILPNATNATYRLSQLADNFIVLDIEPGCPEEIKMKLLTLPYIYGELSMSEKGFHLIFAKPQTKYEDILMEATVLREKNGYYEFLLSHYVTFTGKTIIKAPNVKNRPITDLYKLFDELASEKKLVEYKQIDTSHIPKLNDIIYGKTMIATLNKAVFTGKLTDYVNKNGIPDESEYDFAIIGFYKHNLDLLLSTTKYQKHNYTDQEKIRILYEVIKDKVPQRTKNDELRLGMPFQMYNCMRCLTRC